MRSPVLSEKTVCLVPILRAGNEMLDGFVEIVSGALVGHIGLYRDEETLKAVVITYEKPSPRYSR